MLECATSKKCWKLNNRNDCEVLEHLTASVGIKAITYKHRVICRCSGHSIHHFTAFIQGVLYCVLFWYTADDSMAVLSYVSRRR